MTADEPQVLNAHGAKRLPSVEVDNYNLEIKDEDGFVGDEGRHRQQAAAERLALRVLH